MFRSRERALTEYQRQIGRVLNCIANTWVYTYPISEDTFVLVSADRSTGSNLLRLQRGRETLFLDATQRIQIFDDDDFRITTVRYIYVLWRDKDERIIDWHYHRRKNSSFQAHLHVRDDSKRTSHNLVNKHIPTGRVPLEDVIRFSIQETNISPRESEWSAILEETEAIFRNNRTW